VAADFLVIFNSVIGVLDCQPGRDLWAKNVLKWSTKAQVMADLWESWVKQGRFQDHFRTTISVPYGSKSAFECHSCLLVSVCLPALANS